MSVEHVSGLTNNRRSDKNNQHRRKLTEVDRGLEMNDSDNSKIHAHHINTTMSMLNILKIGNEGQLSTMDFIIKWIDLIMKYFFWGMLEKGLAKI